MSSSSTINDTLLGSCHDGDREKKDEKDVVTWSNGRAVLQSQEAVAAAAPTPDVILAQAKEARYLSHLTSLLTQIAAVPYNLGDAMRPELQLLARVVHTALVTWRDGRDLGMSYLHLTYATTASPTHNTNSNAEPVVPTDRPAILGHLLPTAFLSQSPTLQSVCSANAKALIFVVLTILPPYVVQRAGRGGWVELQSFLSSPPNRRHESSNWNVATRHMEELRGSDRRAYYDRQRARMLQRALDHHVNNEPNNDMPRLDNNSDTNIHQKVTNDAALSSPSSHDDMEQHQGLLHVPSTTLRLQNITVSSLKRCKHLVKLAWNNSRAILWRILQQFAVLPRSPMPHSLPDSDNNNNNNNNIGNDSNISLGRGTALLRWIMRLHLALFYIHGKYPTLTHRLTGLYITTNNNSNNNIDRNSNSSH